MFLNLARNSERAMKEREERVLRVEASVEDEMVRIRFQDSGPGVPNPDALFKPFSRTRLRPAWVSSSRERY